MRVIEMQCSPLPALGFKPAGVNAANVEDDGAACRRLDFMSLVGLNFLDPEIDQPVVTFGNNRQAMIVLRHSGQIVDDLDRLDLLAPGVVARQVAVPASGVVQILRGLANHNAEVFVGKIVSVHSSQDAKDLGILDDEVKLVCPRQDVGRLTL